MPLHRVLLNFLTAALVSIGVAAAPASQPGDARGFSVDDSSASTLSAQLPADIPAKQVQRVALCIGIDKYPGSEFPELHGAVADAEGLAKALAKIGFSKVVVMTDDAGDPDLRPTVWNIRRRVEECTKLAQDQDSSLVISFAGHGDILANKLLLIPSDYGTEHEPFVLDELFTEMDIHSQARNKLLIIDACYAAARARDKDFINALANVQSMQVLCACKAGQHGYEAGQLGHGRFTAALIQGLGGDLIPGAGNAWVPGHQYLTVDDLVHFCKAVFDKKGWTETQTPQVYGQKDFGDFPLASRELPKPPALNNVGKDFERQWLATAEKQYRAGKYVDATDYINSALRMEETAEARGLLALTEWRAGFPADAQRDADAALAADPQQPMALQVAGLVAYKADDNAKSAELLGKVMKLVDDSPGRWPLLITGPDAVDRLLDLSYLNSHSTESPQAIAESEKLATRALVAAGDSSQMMGRALLYRSRYRGRLGRYKECVEDASAVIGLTGVSSDLRADAYNVRAYTYHAKLNRMRDAIDDYSASIAMHGVPSATLAGDLRNRSILYAMIGDRADDIADKTRLIAMKDAPADDVAWALVYRGIDFGNAGDPAREIADETRAIDMSGTSPGLLAVALINRGDAEAQFGDLDKAIADDTRVISMPDAPPEQMVFAYCSRGFHYQAKHDPARAVADETSAIGIKGVPSRNLAQPLLNRGNLYAQQGDSQRADADYTRVIEIPAAPPQPLAWALLNRGLDYFSRGERAKAMADFKSAIAMTDAPAYVVNQASAMLQRLSAPATKP